MNKSWLIRKDQEGVSPVIGTILMVAITVVLAAVLYAMVASVPPTPPDQGILALFKKDTGNNYSLLVTSAPNSALLSSVTLTMRNKDGAVMYPISAMPFSELNEKNWNLYKILYQKQTSTESSITVGSSILIDKETYPTGSGYVVTGSGKLLAQGTL